MKICENCGVEHTGEYGSGRFCSAKCARGFSTKEKRKEINEKISKKMRLVKEPVVCPLCNKSYTQSKKRQVFCSKSCSSKSLSNESRKRISEKMMGVNSGEHNGMFGRIPQFKQPYFYFSKKLNENVKCRSTYEQKAMEIIDNDDNVITFKYEYIKVPYILKGNQRTTILDYYLIMQDGTKKLVEVKPQSLLLLWDNDIKIKAIEKYAEENGMAFEVWTEKELNIK